MPLLVQLEEVALLLRVVLEQEAAALRPVLPIWLAVTSEQQQLGVDGAVRGLLQVVVVPQELLQRRELFWVAQGCTDQLQVLFVFGVFRVAPATGRVKGPGVRQWMQRQGLLLVGLVVHRINKEFAMVRNGE